MKTRLLRNFVTIAELGNLSRAAEKLFIAQPPLSAQLKQFEEQLGVVLFVRHPKGMTLTPAGESLYQDARDILARVDQAIERTRDIHASKQVKLRLGLVPSTTRSILPVILERVRQKPVGAGIQVSNLTSSQQLHAIRHDNIDIGFARINDHEIPAEAIAALDDPYCLAIPSSNRLARETSPIRLKAAATESFVGFNTHEETAYRDRTLALCAQAGFHPDIQHVGGGWSSLLPLISAGLGVGIVPASFATLATPDIVFRRIAASRHDGRLVILRNAKRVDGNTWATEVLSLAVQALRTLGDQLAPYGSQGVTLSHPLSANALQAGHLRQG